jgi:hypothetical protein
VRTQQRGATTCSGRVVRTFTFAVVRTLK